MSEILKGDKHRYEVGRQLAYRGKAGCTDVMCTRGPGWPETCYGWHCPTCHRPTSMMGHDCPEAKTDE
jgi:hypothetical protein